MVLVKRRFLSVLPLMGLLALVQADTFVFPHVLEKSGRIVGVSSSVSGGQEKIRAGELESGFEDVRFEFSPEGSSELLDDIIAEFQSADRPPVHDWTIKRSTNPGGGGTGQAVVVQSTGYTSLAIPAMTRGSRDPASMSVSIACRMGRPSDPSPFTPAQKEALRKQKSWLPANFRVIVDRSPIQVSSIGPLHLVRNGDGAAHAVCSDIELTLSAFDAELLDSKLAIGDGSLRPRMRIEVLNNAGALLFAIVGDPIPIIKGTRDLFDSFRPLSPTTPVMRKYYTGHVTLLKQ
jgi:hypothetical protein